MKEGSTLFKDRVSNKNEASKITAFINKEMIRHIAYTKTKKGSDEVVMKAIAKFEGKHADIVDEYNIAP